MGNCCRTESPCGSVEERCVLLNNDAKATGPVDETTVEGTCSPEDDDIRKIQAKPPNEATVEIEEKDDEDEVKLNPENEETESGKTQENGPLMKESIQSAAASLCQELKTQGDSAAAPDEDVKEPPEHRDQAELLQSTLDSPQKAQGLWEVFTEINTVPEKADAAAVTDRTPEVFSAEWSSPEKPSPTDSTSAADHIAASSSHEDEGKEEVACGATSVNASTVSSGNLNGEVLSMPNSNPAADAGQVVSKPVVNIQEASSRAVTHDSDNGRLSFGGEDVKGHDVSESPPGPEPNTRGQSPRRDRGCEEPETASSVRESVSTDPAGGSKRSKPDQKPEPEPACSPNDFISSENLRPEDVWKTVPQVEDAEGVVPEKVEDGVKQEEEEEVQRAEVVVVNAVSEALTPILKETEIQEATGEESSSDTDLKVELQTVTEETTLVSKVHLDNSEEDLYRAAEELSEPQQEKPAPRPLLESTLVKVEDRCSLAPAVDILSYSEREWKGNTAKSALIRKGYKEMSHRFGSVRRVRGDNYCALRATLFQVLSHSNKLPVWLREEDGGAMLLKQLEAEDDLIGRWTVAGECLHVDGTEDVTQRLRNYVELLRNKWRAAVDCSSAVERQQFCERVFQGGDEELGLLEALKLLMLVRAVELHHCMQGGGDVPLFCWLLFARDTSDCPRSFLSNHLSRVGRTAGLEQVEMFLLGYALQCTIQVYRLYKVDTEEFLTYYPDDHKGDWPSVCLVTEDDRHYNVPVVGAAAGLQTKVETS